ncbi:MAG: M4 family metallopeptidase [Bacteroidetes bacterium]|nr:M4 family metallopeptidase [Bacteroidota bacterium]MBS1559574.1 M4 family metallopeptidase [Bacteroidota bacterium]
MRHFILTKIFPAFVMILIQVSLNAQSDTLEVQKDKNSKIIFVRFRNSGSHRALSNSTTLLKQLLKTQQDDSFKVLKTEKDELGFTHQLMQHYFKGLKVEGSEYLVHSKSDNIETINGSFAQIKANNTSPQIDSIQALSNSLKVINANKYSWQTSKDLYYPKVELLFASKDDNINYVLCWKFAISAIDPILSENVYVDAQTGKVIKRISLICNVNSAGTAATRYSGTQAITTDSYNGAFRLREVLNNVNINTFNFQHSNDYTNTSTAIDFTDNDNNWTAAEYNDANRDNAALDAHWASEQILNYWRIVRNRNSLNNNGLALNNYVHFYSNYDNAFWSPSNTSMFYGDGGTKFNAVVALDVCAHETGHGVCQFTANLGNGSREALALNEGLSDIWGAVIEHWAAPNKQTWEIGEDIMLNGVPCLRSLSNPKTGGDGNPIITGGTGGYPNTYQGQFWDANGEPHTNSTVISHWFYLLSVGGCGHIDDNANKGAYTVYGITMDKAASIVYRAESNYLTSSANYAAARTAMISAATDLYGATSNEVAQVTNAWYAAGVGAAYTGSASPIVSSSNPICSTSNLSIPNLPAGATVTSWTSSNPSGLSINSNTGVATVQNNFNGQVYISALVNGSCGTVNVQPATVWVGNPIFNAISIDGTVSPYPLCGYGNISFSANTDHIIVTNASANASGQPAPVAYALTGTPGAVSGSTLSSTSYDFRAKSSNTNFNITISASNSCGTTQQCLYFSNGAGPMVITYPNPASQMLTVQITGDSSIYTPMSDEPYQLNLINDFSQSVYSIRSSDCLVHIPLDGIPPGIYYLNLFYQDIVVRQHIIIKK